MEAGTGIVEGIGDDAATVGLNGPGGTLIASNATGRILAHEVGHACGLEDVYVSRPNETSLYLDGLATEARMPGDWGGGFYPKGASQAEVIMRLLMYGVQDESSFEQGDVTSGKVYGLGYRWAGSSKVWSLDKFKTGFDGMTTRQPEHL